MATTLTNGHSLYAHGKVTVASGSYEEVIVAHPQLLADIVRNQIPGVNDPNPGPVYWIGVLPLEIGAVQWHVGSFVYIYNTPMDPTSGVAALQFRLYADAGPNGNVDYRVEVHSRHSKTR